jgi:hypothetical protein
VAASAEEKNHHRASAKEIYSSSDLLERLCCCSRAEENWRCGLEQATCALLARCGAFGGPEETPVRRQDRQSVVSLSLLVRPAHIQRLRKVCIAGLCGVIYRYRSTGRWAAGLIGCLRRWWLIVEALKGGD